MRFTIMAVVFCCVLSGCIVIPVAKKTENKTAPVVQTAQAPASTPAPHSIICSRCHDEISWDVAEDAMPSAPIPVVQANHRGQPLPRPSSVAPLELPTTESVVGVPTHIARRVPEPRPVVYDAAPRREPIPLDRLPDTGWHTSQ